MSAELSEQELLASGHRACAGCGCILAMRYVLKALGKDVIVSMATGCMEVVTTPYPETSWRVPWIHVAFENAAAVASGVARALKQLGKHNVKSVAIAGDGGTADIGLQALSGAVERGENMLYVCLPPETELVLGDGSIIKIGEFANKVMAKNRVMCNGGVESAKVDGTVLSWDGENFSPQRILHIQRVRSPRKMIRIVTSSGCSLTLTPEHKVLVDTSEGLLWRPAVALGSGNKLIAPRKVQLGDSGTPSLIDITLNVIGDQLHTRIQPQLVRELKKKLMEKYGTLKRASSELGIKKWWLREKFGVPLTGLKKICDAVGYNWAEIRSEISMVGKKNRYLLINLGEGLDPKLMYLLGLLATDGSISKTPYSSVFVNSDKHLLQKFKEIYAEFFPTRKISTARTSKNTVAMSVSNPVLYALAKFFGIKSDPKEIIKLPEEHIAAFLRGCFDGDGCVSIMRHKFTSEPRILISTVNDKFSRRLRMMLQRLGIASTKLGGKRHDVILYSASDIARFIDRVNTEDPCKKKKFAEVAELMCRKHRGRKFELAPAACNKLIREICIKHGIPPTNLDRNLCQILDGNRGATKEKIRKIIRKLSTDDPKVTELERLTSDNFYLDEVKSVEEIKSTCEHVYDITVEGTHLFVPEGGFVVSNCYDNEAYENTGIQRSGSTPYKAWTTTTPIGKFSRGEDRHKKDLPAIIAAHGAPYVATASVAYPLDFIKKLRKAATIDGPTYVHVLAPCTPGWRIEDSKTIEVARLAVLSGAWILYEVENGKTSVTFKPPKRRPVADYLKLQGRFKHLTEGEIAEIQLMVDEQCKRFGIE